MNNLKLLVSPLDEGDLILFATPGIYAGMLPYELGLNPGDLNIEAPSWDKVEKNDETDQILNSMY